MEKIQLMIVDDHPLFRQGLRRVLEREEDVEVVGEWGDGEEALKSAIANPPALILMDVNLPHRNGLQLTREVKDAVPQVQVIILTGYHDDEQLFHSIRAGASAYFSKEVAPRELLAAIRQVVQGRYVIGGRYLSRTEAVEWLMDQLKEYQGVSVYAEEAFTPLSPREMEILEHIARGLSNKEVAHTLGISRQTVKNHMTAILRKLNVDDRTQAAIYALRHGWIRLQDTR